MGPTGIMRTVDNIFAVLLDKIEACMVGVTPLVEFLLGVYAVQPRNSLDLISSLLKKIAFLCAYIQLSTHGQLGCHGERGLLLLFDHA